MGYSPINQPNSSNPQIKTPGASGLGGSSDSGHPSPSAQGDDSIRAPVRITFDLQRPWACSLSHHFILP